MCYWYTAEASVFEKPDQHWVIPAPSLGGRKYVLYFTEQNQWLTQYQEQMFLLNTLTS